MNFIHKGLVKITSTFKCPRRFALCALPFALCAFLVLPAPAAVDDVRITEFMAANTGDRPDSVRDENGFAEDWIEIFNAGDNTVNLLNWSLTDNAGDLNQWSFPSTNIGPGQFMIVFASGNDRGVPGAPLHTNFKLEASGEFLALVKPDGTIATRFPPTYPIPNRYPTQFPDVSYGLGVLTTNQVLVSTSSIVRMRVPSDNSDGTNWTTATFDDSGWTPGTNGVGFGSTNVTQADYSAAVLPTAPVGYWRFSEATGPTAANDGSGSGLDGAYNNVTVGTDGPRPPQFNGFEPTNRAPTFDGASSYVTVNNSLLSGRSAFTIGGWIRPAVTPANRTGLFGQNDVVEFGFINPTQLQCWTPSGGSVNANYTHAAGQWHHVVAVGDGATIRIFIDGALGASGGTATANYGSSAFNFNIGGGGIFDSTTNWFNGQIDEVVVYHRALTTNEIRSLYIAGTNAVSASVLPFVKTDVGAAMSNVNASAYVRIPFTVNDPTNVALLTLRMRYDDGFAAFINGVEVARVNAPETLSHNSSATNTHLPISVDEFRVGPGALQAGSNTLAIQGLNVAVDDSDFLVLAELSATKATALSTNPVYFTTASPGAINSSGVAVPGPSFIETTHVPNVPLDAQDLLVSARVVPTFAPLSRVVMRYRIMFNPEIEVAMFDDGVHGDGAPNDGIYGATIPASASTNGQMIRWFFRAIDSQSRTSRWPLFTDPAETAEYLGTIVDPTNLTSKLPIVHLFAPPAVLGPGPTTTQTGADSQAGAKVSLFHDGEFYDNIDMELRGNSTANYNKKSHRLNFNREHIFRQQGMDLRVRHTSFVADYPDPTYMRQGLTYSLGNAIGVPSPFYNPVRLQLNGQFYQLANHNDVPEAEQLERLGYDGNGALYNAAGQVTPGRASTGGFEKKTRRWDNDSDYTVLSTGISETNSSLAVRRTNAFEYFDVPNIINYCVLGRWVRENDDVWANMSLYHDNDGDNLWRIVPFDMNLSWGAIFHEGTPTTTPYVEGVQAADDPHKGFPLYGSSQALALAHGNDYNRVYDVIFQVPQFREMFLRRLRTVMDTHIKPIGTPPNTTAVEQLILNWRDLIAEEAARDRAWWGWPAKGGQCNFDPGIDLPTGVSQLLTNFFLARRQHFYGRHCITNTALAIGITKTNNAGIPLTQPTNAVVEIAGLEYNPPTTNQSHEYLCITNPNPYAVDISGWTLSTFGGGATNVKFTFKGGTVIPSNGVLYLTPDIVSFRTRPTSPRGREGLFVVGNYRGQLSARGETLFIHDDRGRPVHTNTYSGMPSLVQQFLRITEIMYHPALPAGGPYDREQFEYIELKNVGPLTLDLTGVHFTNGIDFRFTNTMLTSEQTVLLVRNQAAFTSRYGSGFNIAGQYGGALENGGERLRLDDAVGEEILDFEYNNSWYPITDGHGFSLVIVNEDAPFHTWDEKESWRPSGLVGGSPGQPDPAPPVFAPILVNEVLSHTDEPGTRDAIELYNPTAGAVDIGGWFLSDDFGTARKYRIPAGTMIDAGGYRVFDETHFNPAPGVPPSFSFSAQGDEAYLFSGDASTNLTGYVHGFRYGAAENAVSFGRYINSQTNVHFVAQSTTTFGAANGLPKVGPVVVAEIMYHPLDKGTNDNSLDEYIRLHNFSSNAVPLYDPLHATNTWRLRDAVDFDLPPNILLPAGGSLVVAGFDPVNAAMLAAFRATFGIPDHVPVFGPLAGKLDNSNENVELYKPDPPDTNGVVPYVLVEQIQYDDGCCGASGNCGNCGSAWPRPADGAGFSLLRIHLSAYGNDPTNWTAVRVVRPKILVQPEGKSVRQGSNVTFSVVATSLWSLITYQWRRDNMNIAGATNSSYNIPSVQLDDGGNYTVVVTDEVGATVSAPASLVVLINPVITQQPLGLTVAAGSTVNFSVSATGNPLPFGFRWRRIGLQHSFFQTNQTSMTLTLNSVSNGNAGNWTVIVTNQANPSGAISTNAYLTVVTPPTNQTVPLGGTATFTVRATNVAGSFPGYQWRFNGGDISGATTNYYSVTNVQQSHVGTYSLVVTATNLPAPPPATFSATLALLVTGPSLSNPEVLSDGVFRAQLEGTLNQMYAIESSQDLTNWAVLTNLTFSGSPAYFVDPGRTNAAGATNRFYRARETQ